MKLVRTISTINIQKNKFNNKVHWTKASQYSYSYEQFNEINSSQVKWQC